MEFILDLIILPSHRHLIAGQHPQLKWLKNFSTYLPRYTYSFFTTPLEHPCLLLSTTACLVSSTFQHTSVSIASIYPTNMSLFLVSARFVPGRSRPTIAASERHLRSPTPASVILTLVQSPKALAFPSSHQRLPNYRNRRVFGPSSQTRLAPSSQVPFLLQDRALCHFVSVTNIQFSTLLHTL